MGDDNTVTLSVQSDLKKVIADLEALQKKAAAVSQQVQRTGTDLDKNLGKSAKTTEQHFERLRDLGRRLADQLRGYFSSIATQTSQSLERVKTSLGLRQQFIDATKGAIDLHDVIRKIGGSLDIANNRLGDFQKNITKAFTEAGFGADAAGRALQGIAGTQVSGEANSQDYAMTSTKLAQAGGQAGSEGEIGKAMAEILRLRNIDQNNMVEMHRLANSVRGHDPLGKLEGQKAMYGAMEPSQRGKFGPEAMRSFGAIRKEVGPEMDDFITKMTQGWLEKLPAAAQGLGKIVNKDGIDFKELNKNAPMLKRLGDDTNASGATLGLSPTEARGLYAMWKHSQKAQAAQERARSQSGTLDEDVGERRGLGENAAAVKNRVGGKIQGVLAKPIGAASDLLGRASKTDLGAAAVMGGGFLAATAGAFGAGKLAKLLGGTAGNAAGSIAKAGALEQITGQKTIPVYVVNFGEMGGGLGGLGGGAAGQAAIATAATSAATTAAIAALPLMLVGGGVLEAYQVESKAAREKKVLSGNDTMGGAKGGGSVALVVDLFKQVIAMMGHGNSSREKHNTRSAEAAQREAQVTPPSDERRGTSAAAVSGPKY